MRTPLRNERVRRKWIQSFVAQELGIKLRTYQYYESGERDPSLEVVTRIEDLFGIPATRTARS